MSVVIAEKAQFQKVVAKPTIPSRHCSLEAACSDFAEFFSLYCSCQIIESFPFAGTFGGIIERNMGTSCIL